ncbi:hypothetical protein Misp01_32730 [Microtetraspora sp. NBRC 13810]|uniref:hypothetical protein n=1 Tax=Microtetraspora sp. NBRC 13810 TaxID=3030990 RepID=UPI0024A43659|nr:hypothetical protein [Microtetraspora sp. NBRC 13810]GLW08143.1 hypothetical protein Misp01_32730 [Microtetraspora sp. NBRC 13810]
MTAGAAFPDAYRGRPFHDGVRATGVQRVPGRLMCAFYDTGGEGVAYHDAADRNQGSGGLNPLDGGYLNGFRADEAVGVSYTKGDGIDDHPYNDHLPEPGLLYVGWTSPGNWLRYTVEVTGPGPFAATLLYTAAHDGAVALTVDDAPVEEVVEVPCTAGGDDVEWRRYHHWALLPPFRVPALTPGRHVLTLHTVRTGQMNYAWLDFHPTG